MEYSFDSPIKEAVETLTKALDNDPGYRVGWVANIAVQFQDEVSRHKKKIGSSKLSKSAIHEISNKAAENFISLLCYKPKSPETPTQ